MKVKNRLDDLYQLAKEHKNSHKSCGAEPYLDYEYLFNFLKEKSEMSNDKQKDFNILELGTGIGFTALVMNQARPSAQIDSIENNLEHVVFAKKWALEVGVKSINFIQADVHTILPYLEHAKYDFIFFDVYGPKEKYLADFERILKPGGTLYSLNAHLKSAEQNYFDYLNTSDKWQKLAEFGDTRIYKYVALDIN